MDKEIIKRLQRVTLTKEEDKPIHVAEEEVCQGVEDLVNSCVGHLYSSKEFSIRVMRLLVSKVW